MGIYSGYECKCLLNHELGESIIQKNGLTELGQVVIMGLSNVSTRSVQKKLMIKPTM